MVCKISNVKVNRIKEEKFGFEVEPTKIGQILAKWTVL